MPGNHPRPLSLAKKRAVPCALTTFGRRPAPVSDLQWRKYRRRVARRGVWARMHSPACLSAFFYREVPLGVIERWFLSVEGGWRFSSRIQE